MTSPPLTTSVPAQCLAYPILEVTDDGLEAPKTLLGNEWKMEAEVVDIETDDPYPVLRLTVANARFWLSDHEGAGFIAAMDKCLGEKTRGEWDECRG